MIEMMLLKKSKIVGLVAHKIVIFIASTAMTMTTVFANPTGGVVTSGSATIVQAPNTPNTLQIHQGSDKAIIQWQSFNINAAQKTQFIQPTKSSVMLNRINPSQGASQIFGQLSANGRIILVNQAGIYFGPGSRVDVGGIIASTSNITNQNFLAGKFIFDQPSGTSGSIVNKGTITAADYGLVALMGKTVVNDGVINARLGNVVLASGNKFTLDFYGDQLINFSVDEAAETASVKNSGSILADGGTVRISARSAQGVVDNVINMKGVVQARSVSQKNGVIILDGGSGTVTVAGNINASGKQYGQRGGKVKILAKKVRVQAPTVIDVSGDIGGGEILIGGNYQGRGPEQNALSTSVDSGVVLAANAIRSGNGGKVVVWSDGDTAFHGSIFARGGALGGDGGAYVETSGHDLNISGAKVDLSAPKGKAGLWLIDPTNITISAAATSGESFGSGTYSPSGAAANILNTELNANLELSNILVTTASADGSAGTITVSDPITWLSANTLTLRSNNAIAINAAISGANGGLTLEAGLLAGTPASITTGVSGTINVGTFNLAYGNWSQVGTLPAFHATDFRLNSGNGPSNNVSFIRALSGDGGGTPYLLTDIYGVEGMGSNATTLGYTYELNNNIDASGTTAWNSGAGFRPIGITNLFAGGGSLFFTGSLDGNNHAIDSLYIGGIYDDFVRPDTGLFAGIDS
ncbi:MAG: filamentous hemagglutinin N-terminal domain-containing protein, partial [Gammaproteobacteria bacterium]